MARSIRIGISGWTYPPWRKTFYPSGLPHRRELEFASRQVTSIEVNGSFYALQRPATFEKWYAEVPEDFIFSVKAPRFITHIKKLHDVDEPVANFFASGLLRLDEKLGPILWQLPPSLKFQPERFENFLKLLPHDLKAATRLAKKHGEKMKGRTYFPSARAKNHRLRHAIEVRHESFKDPAFVTLLKRYDVAVVTADSAGHYPEFDDVTTDFTYFRLHGAVELYASGYTEKALDAWADRMKRLKPARDIFVYFDNDIKVQAPYNAVSLLKRLVKNYEPAVAMDPKAVAGNQTPGPRLDKVRPARKKAR